MLIHNDHFRRSLDAFKAIKVLLLLILVFALQKQSSCASDISEKFQTLAESYGIQVITDDLMFPVRTTHGPIDGKKASDEEMKAYGEIFLSEFALYPKELVKRSGLKRVVLCSELSFAGQRRNAIPDFEHDTLYLEVSRGSYNKKYMRKVVHHEFFHIIDFRDDGLLYKDDRWGRLYPDKFKYGDGGRNAQSLSETSVLTDKFPGFLNHYSTTGVEEDKAEVFANLIVEPRHVEDKTRKDPVFDRKVQAMKVLLSSFCVQMDEQFWARAQKVQR
jgi:hypothetical protein